MDASDTTRRQFVKQAVAGSAAVAAGVASAQTGGGVTDDLPHHVLQALGEVFVPAKVGDPGYREVESFGITDAVLKKLVAAETGAGKPATEEASPLLTEFNTAAKSFFGGKSFLELSQSEREQYLELIIDGSKIPDAALQARLRTFYREARHAILTVYYQNYPKHEVKRNAHGEPILKAGDTHQITNTGSFNVVSAWDVVGYSAPLNWEEEERRRAVAKKMRRHWWEGDLATLNAVKPAAPLKTSDGKDYYDVVVVGGGTAGCIVAGRLAERGINPKTGDRLRVAMVEGGDDWPIRDAAIRPGYGAPVRRRMTPNLIDGLGPESSADPDYHWPHDGHNFKLLGGCSLHYGGSVFFPTADDFDRYRETSGVNWTPEMFEEAIEEIREIFHVTLDPPEGSNKGTAMYGEAGRSLGLRIQAMPAARVNCLNTHYCWDGYLCRYDAKGTSLPWAYTGLNNGLKIIANAEAEKILIERPAGGSPVATGVVYKDKSGTHHEIRAARVIVACGTFGSALLFYRSGYGQRELLGDKLIIENKNVGKNLDGDVGFGANVAAYFPEPILEDNQGPAGMIWCAPKARPYGELNARLSVRVREELPDSVALGAFAPEFGWKHKEYMRVANKHIGSIATDLHMLPWKWEMKPDGKRNRLSLDERKINAALKEAVDVTMAWYEKLAVKPQRIERQIQPATSLRPGHDTGTARAGENREVSVCTSDFDCHDIEHLMIVSGASMPRTLFCWGMGPIAAGAAYAWRRFAANHFSPGCSTRGFV